MERATIPERTCACGCGARFRSTRALDVYASAACEELHTRSTPREMHARHAKRESGEPRDPGAMDLSGRTVPLRLDPREWINAAELALRLDVSQSAVCRWANMGQIPFHRVTRKIRLFHAATVIAQLRARGRLKK